MQLADMLGMAQQQAPSVLPPLGQMPGAPMPPLQMSQNLQATPLQQQQAPERSVQAPQQAPQAMPQQAPVQPQGDPTWGSRWQAIKQKLDDPTVMGPLQTFFGVLGAPLGPGENVGTRMARASMMMQSHRQMLMENQKAEETAAQDRQMKIEDRNLTREEKQLNIKKLGVETTAKEQGMAPALAKDMQELEKQRLIIENLPQVQKDAMLNAQSTRNYQGAMADKARREPVAASEKTYDKAKYGSLMSSWRSTVEGPFLEWKKGMEAAGKASEVSLDAFYETERGKLAKSFVQQMIDDKTPMGSRVLGGGKSSSNIVTPSVDTLEAVRARVQKAKEGNK